MYHSKKKSDGQRCESISDKFKDLDCSNLLAIQKQTRLLKFSYAFEYFRQLPRHICQLSAVGSKLVHCLILRHQTLCNAVSDHAVIKYRESNLPIIDI